MFMHQSFETPGPPPPLGHDRGNAGTFTSYAPNSGPPIDGEYARIHGLRLRDRGQSLHGQRFLFSRRIVILAYILIYQHSFDRSTEANCEAKRNLQSCIVQKCSVKCLSVFEKGCCSPRLVLSYSKLQKTVLVKHEL